MPRQPLTRFLLLSEEAHDIEAAMSMRKTIRNAPTFFALLAFLFMRLASVNGAVACFGSDGHVGLEGPHAAIGGAVSNVQSGDSSVLQASLSASVEQTILDASHALPCFDLMAGHTNDQDASASFSSMSEVFPGVVLPAP